MSDTEERRVTEQKAWGTTENQELVAVYNEKLVRRQACLLELSRGQRGRQDLHKVKNKTVEQEHALTAREEEIEALREELKELVEFINFARPVVGETQKGTDATVTTGGADTEKQASRGRFRMPDAQYLPCFRAAGSEQPANLQVYFRDLARVLLDHQVAEDHWTSAMALALPKSPPIHREFVYQTRESFPGAGFDEVVRLFIRRFTKQSSVEQMEVELERLKQGAGSVTAYYGRFIELVEGTEEDRDSGRVRRKFRRGLSAPLQKALVGHFGDKIEDVLLHVLFESAQQNEAAVYEPDVQGRPGSISSQEQDGQGRPKSKFKVFNCFNCGKEGHRRGDPECKGMKGEEKKKEPEDKGAHQTSWKDGGKSGGHRKMAPIPEVSKPWVSRESGKCFCVGRRGTGSGSVRVLRIRKSPGNHSLGD